MFLLFNTPPSTEFYTLSLHDALPISPVLSSPEFLAGVCVQPVHSAVPTCAGEAGAGSEYSGGSVLAVGAECGSGRSEEHTSELQSRENLVCRLLLEKKKNIHKYHHLL